MSTIEDKRKNLTNNLGWYFCKNNVTIGPGSPHNDMYNNLFWVQAMDVMENNVKDHRWQAVPKVYEYCKYGKWKSDIRDIPSIVWDNWMNEIDDEWFAFKVVREGKWEIK